ncbi:MAG: chemotaxis protein CheD [Verrucomicrobia bacterium]|nr:chemotaxis protein CheD [Verrucomicrobiota bacterium]
MAPDSQTKSIVVGLGDMAVSDCPGEMLVTYSLGSCLGVTFYDPVLRVGGMVHCMMPLSQIDGDKAREKPCTFVDIGVPRLIEEMFKRGCRKKDLVTRVAGAARMMDSANFFRIGERNHAVFRKIMWKNGMFIHAEDTGGEQARTLLLEIATGRALVRSSGQEREL